MDFLFFTLASENNEKKKLLAFESALFTFNFVISNSYPSLWFTELFHITREGVDVLEKVTS